MVFCPKMSTSKVVDGKTGLSCDKNSVVTWQFFRILYGAQPNFCNSNEVLWLKGFQRFLDGRFSEEATQSAGKNKPTQNAVRKTAPKPRDLRFP
jgi:hypothetical protein